MATIGKLLEVPLAQKKTAILFQMKRTQELGNKASALKREVEILRASARQHKEKLQHLHELLASREEMHR